jgi:hypothetical protein
MLNLLVWGIGALWVFHRFNEFVLRHKPLPPLDVTQKLAFLLVPCLMLSAFVSPAPLLTAFRVFQTLIMIGFGYFWVRRYGIDSTLRRLIAGYSILALAIAYSAVAAPDLVLDGSRLRGHLIANTGSVSAMGIILGLSYPVFKGRALYLVALVALFGVLLVLAMTRSAYAAVIVFLLLSFLRFPRSTPLRRSMYLLLALVPAGLLFNWGGTIVSWLVRESQSVATLSDRIPLWAYTLSVTFDRSPLIGLGYYANRLVTSSYNPGLGTSHSAFVEVLSGGGILSFAVFAALTTVWLSAAVRLLVARGREASVFASVSLCFAVLSIGLVSEEMVVASPTAFTFWMLVSLLPALRERGLAVGRQMPGVAADESARRSQLLPATGR